MSSPLEQELYELTHKCRLPPHLYRTT